MPDDKLIDAVTEALKKSWNAQPGNGPASQGGARYTAQDFVHMMRVYEAAKEKE